MNRIRRTLCVVLTTIFVLAFASQVVLADDTYYLTWEEYMTANGVTDWNYNDLAAAIAGVANHAVDLYEAGEKDEAYTYAKATYWGFYETSGFERNTMNYISGSRVSEVELAFTTLRKAIKKDNGLDAVRAAADSLIEKLVTDGLILSPEGPVFAEAAGTSGGSGAAQGQAAVLDTYYLSWDEHREAYGVGDWNYNDLASVIAGVANHAVELYNNGEMEDAYAYAKATYWGYYETSGFERNTMNYISGSRVSEVELAFTTLRKAIKKDNGAEAVQAAADSLSSKLFEDGLILSPEGPVAGTATASAGAETASAGTAKTAASGIAVFLGAFAIILREGLEAILIVGAIIAYLIKTGNSKSVFPVYIGSALGVVCSFIMAGIINMLLARSAEYHMSQEIIEGIAALTAVVVLFWVSNWMVSKSEAAVWSQYIEGRVASSATTGNVIALGFTAWLAVFREGAEVILFYQPMLAEDRPDMVWVGFGIGVVFLVVIFLAIRFMSVRLPLKPFFMGTSILMAAMSICFLGAGIKELMEGGVLDGFEWAIYSPTWLSWIPYNDVLDVLGIYPLIGTIVPQLILLAITIATFIMHLKHNKQVRLEAEKAAES
ncbi:MAG: FTR1 family protein [Eubacteriales bacterium]|nr:FTR1 family protein [Eubacteriales bacterium]